MRLLLADDHALVREGLRHTLSGLAPDTGFVEAATAAETLDALAGDRDVELVLLDLVMPGSNGFELLTRVCNEFPDLPVVVLSGSSDPADMRKALDISAAGFITKNATAEVMRSALRLVLAGGIYVPPDMLRETAADAESAAPRRPRDGTQVRTTHSALTARQCDVLALIGEGKSNKQIARELGLSENTVKIHVAAVLRALGVDNRTQAAVIAREHSESEVRSALAGAPNDGGSAP